MLTAGLDRAFLALAIFLGVCVSAEPTGTKTKCYTATVTTPPKVCPLLRCAPPLQCLRLETEVVTLPCPNSDCPTTQTKTEKGKCPGCRQIGCPTITNTVISSPCPGCYTAVTRVSQSTGCPPEPTDCVELQCIELITETRPCPTEACPCTPTSTSTFPCKTACRAGCATGILTETASCPVRGPPYAAPPYGC